MIVNHSNNYEKCWIGKEKFLKKEIQHLNNLLYLVLDKKINLALYSDQINDIDWVCNISPKINDCGGKISLCTSGSTGNVKIIEHDLNNLLKNKKGIGSFNDKWLLTYNPARWAGMSVLLHCLKNNCRLIIPEDLSINSISNELSKATHISLTPSLFRKILLSYNNPYTNLKLKQVTFGGEYIDQATLNLAKSFWPTAKITHIYALTEVGDVCSSSDGLEGYDISKLSSFNLSLSGEAIIDGFNTGDYWEIKNNRIIFVGRKNDIINVGGNKVYPSQIESLAMSCHGVSACKVYGVKNNLLGQIVAMDYVGVIDKKELINYLKEQLQKYAVPLLINKVDVIKLTAANKISRM